MSETTNLKLNKHDNVSTNTNQFDIDNYLNANWDKIDEAVGENKITIKTLEEENKRLKADLNGLPKGTAEGENIDLADSADMRFSSFKISGNSKQEIREGYNLLPYPYKETTKTSNGITWTINDDGSIKVSGTSTGTSFIDLYSNGTEKITTPNERYTFALIKKDGNFGFSFHYYHYVGGWNNIITGTNIKSFTPYDNGSTGDLLRILVEGTGQTVNETIYPILLKGEYTQDTLPKYEKYGVSPSINYSSEVESCGDNINLFDGESEVGNIDATTGLNSDGTTAWRSKNYIHINDTSLSISAKDLIFSGTVGRLYFYKNDNTYISNILISSLPFTTVLPNETAKVRFFILNSVANINSKIKISEGTSTGYSEYGQGCINEVICNKNILDYDKTSYGFYSSSSIFEGAKVHRISDFIKAESNKQYIASTNRIIGYLYIYEFDINKNLLKRSALTNVKENLITTTNSTKYIRVSYNIDNHIEMTIDKLKEIEAQLEKDSISTEYEEHKEQVFTIPTQQPMLMGDYFDWDNKEEVHNWAKYEFTGNENVTKHSTTNNNAFAISNIPTNILRPINNNTNANVLSSNFLSYAVNTVVFSNREGIGIDVNGNIIYIGTGLNSTITTAEQLKSCFTKKYNAGTPVYIWYKLASPIRLTFTEEQKVVLEEIYQNAKTYKGTTHIYSTDEVGAVVEVEYFVLTDEQINNEGNIQSRPILRLEKTTSEVVELTINDIRFKYNFGDDTYIEIDCEEKTVEYEGLNRNRKISIGYEFPKLNIGSNKIVMHDGDCVIKVLRKDRWL